jgi:hypothetical protein
LINLRESPWIFIVSETIIFTILTFAAFGARNICVVALTIFFQTEGSFTIARPFLRFCRLFVGILRPFYFLVVPRVRLFLAIWIFCILASNTFASLTTLISWINKKKPLAKQSQYILRHLDFLQWHEEIFSLLDGFKLVFL